VWIEHEGGRPFVADPTVVTFYNRAQPYRRRALGPEGDRCDWYAFAPEVVTEVVAAVDPSAEQRPDRPFAFTHGDVDPASYAEQRAVAHHVAEPGPIDALAVEETMLRVLARVVRLACARRRGQAPSPTSVARRAEEAVDRVRAHVLASVGERHTLKSLSRLAGRSPFHLCRAFSQVTGGPLHAWLLRLRLQLSLERVAAARDLTAVALDLGFASHSHFGAAFRRAFGLTPSEWRRRARARDLLRLRAHLGPGGVIMES
jgi:AraC-like DNA-binding protein